MLDRSDDREAEALAWLRLARSRNVGPATFARLLKRYGSAAKALEALPDLATRGGDRAYAPCSERQARDEMARAAATGARMLRPGDSDYPARLAEIADPPPLLWLRGDAALLERRTIAIVGARNASSIGRRMARLLAGELGERGWLIASGFARGIDTAAHEAALPTGTVAALAGGVDVSYPRENAALLDRIAAEGVLISEAPPGLSPQARHFPRRNRIVSGLAEGVVLIEAAARSGSLITARLALEQGREVMAAPGAPLDPRSAGCNDLIRQGAVLIRDVDDVTAALEPSLMRVASDAEGPGPSDTAENEPRGADPDLAERVRVLLTTAAIETDILARDLQVSPADLAEALLELELVDAIERRAGGLVALSAGE